MKHAIRVWNEMGQQRRTTYSAIVLVEADSDEEAEAKVQDAFEEHWLEDALLDGSRYEETESDVMHQEQEDSGMEATEVSGDLTCFFDLDDYLAEEGE